ncbi:MAG: serine hydrolase [Negativicutes bacterium]|nr:serine hydrolase [Negativicutes bacterium]
MAIRLLSLFTVVTLAIAPSLPASAAAADPLAGVNQQLRQVLTSDSSAADQQRQLLWQQLAGNCQKAQAAIQAPGLVVAVVENDSLVYWQGFGQLAADDRQPPDLDTIFPIGRLTQPLTASLAALAVDRRYFSWDSPLAKVYPPFQWNNSADRQSVTVRQLLANAAGLPADAGVGQSLFGATRQDILLAIPAISQLTPPGTICQPQLATHTLLGKLLERHGERPWEKILSDDLLRYLSMFRTTTGSSNFIDAVDRFGLHQWQNGQLRQLPDNWPYLGALYEYGAGLAVNSTVRNLGNFLIMQLNDGMFAHRQVISPASLRETRRPVAVTADDPGTWGCPGWLYTVINGQDIFYQYDRTGGCQSVMAFAPDLHTGVIIVANLSRPLVVRDLAIDFLAAISQPPLPPLAADRLAAWRAARLSDQPPAAFPDPADPSPFVGRYRHPLYGTIVVTAEQGRLYAQLGYVNLRYPLQPIGGDRYHLDLPYLIDDLSGTVSFGRPVGGRYSQLTVDAFSTPAQPAVFSRQ